MAKEPRTQNHYSGYRHQEYPIVTDNQKLFAAVKRCGVQDVTTLIDEGASIDAIDEDGYSLLHYAVINGNNKLCAYLISKGAKVNEVNNDDDTPLHLASYLGLKDITKTLLQHGADVTIKNNDNKIAKYLAKNTDIQNLFNNQSIEAAKPDLSPKVTEKQMSR